MNIQFQAHGKFTLRVEGRLLITEVCGPWNVELVELWAKESRDLVKYLSARGKWASLAIVKQSLLSTPDAMAILGEVMSYAVKEANMVASAKVRTEDVEGFGLVEPLFHNMYKNLCPFNFFTDTSAASDWLEQFIADD